MMMARRRCGTAYINSFPLSKSTYDNLSVDQQVAGYSEHGRRGLGSVRRKEMNSVEARQYDRKWIHYMFSGFLLSVVLGAVASYAAEQPGKRDILGLETGMPYAQALSEIKRNCGGKYTGNSVAISCVTRMHKIDGGPGAGNYPETLIVWFAHNLPGNPIVRIRYDFVSASPDVMQSVINQFEIPPRCDNIGCVPGLQLTVPIELDPGLELTLDKPGISPRYFLALYNRQLDSDDRLATVDKLQQENSPPKF
jgi:hypothetical protein